ncbi:MAG: porin [Thiomonas sp.]
MKRMPPMSMMAARRLSLTPVAAVLCGLLAAQNAYAEDPEIAALKQQVQTMLARIQQLEARQSNVDAEVAAQQQRGPQSIPGRPAMMAERKAEKNAEMSNAPKVYGQLRLSIDNYSQDFGKGSGSTPGSGTTVSSNASRFGFTGSLPTSLPDTRMTYRAEVQYGAASNTNQDIGWREGYAGLTGPWGTFKLGRQDSAYKTTLTTIDPWNDNAPQSRGFGGIQGSSAIHAAYITNAMQYDTPSFGGLKGAAWYAVKTNGSTASQIDSGPLVNYLGGKGEGVGLKFNRGGWFAGADWIHIAADQVGSYNTTYKTNLSTGVTTASQTFVPNTKMHTGSGWQVAARYQQDAWSVAAFYEDVKTLGLGRNAYVNGTYQFGLFKLIAAYGQNRNATQFFNRAIDTWSIGTKYALTKDSELIAAWVNRHEDAYSTTPARTYQIFTIGINAKFGY